MAEIGVLGSGTWGTALSIHLAGCGHQVTLWSALPQEIRDLYTELWIQVGSGS